MNYATMQSRVFHGNPDEIQEQLSAFLKEHVIRIHGFAQSQSSGTDNVVITTTLLYTEYQKERKEVMGFGR